MTKRSAKLLLLKVLAAATGGHDHKVNLIGRPYQKGNLELRLGLTLSAEERALLGKAFEELKREDLIRSDYGDLSDPENWVDITEKGRRSLERQAIDRLDEVLYSIDPRLTEMREGAWSRLDAGGEDALRQASDAMRELIDQSLHALVTDDEIKAKEWFKPDDSAETGVTRWHRARLVMEKRSGQSCDAACDQLVACVKRLNKLKHAHKPLQPHDVENAVKSAELAFETVLLEGMPQDVS